MEGHTRAAVQRAALAFAGEEQRSQEAARIAELERLVGRLTLESEIAKKAAGLLSPLLSPPAPRVPTPRLSRMSRRL